jgi:hypothetical protein
MRQDPLRWNIRASFENPRGFPRVVVLYGSNKNLKTALQREISTLYSLHSVEEKSFLDSPHVWLEDGLFGSLQSLKGIALLDATQASIAFIRLWLNTSHSNRFFVVDVDHVPGGFTLDDPRVYMVPCYVCDIKPLQEWIQKKIRNSGLIFARDALGLLMEHVGEDTLDHALEQLSLWSLGSCTQENVVDDCTVPPLENLQATGGKNDLQRAQKPIGIDQVAMVLSIHKDYHIQEQLFHWMVSPSSTLESLRHLETGEFMAMVRFLGRLFSQLWQLQQGLKSGQSVEMAQSQVMPAIFFKHRPWLIKYAKLMEEPMILQVIEKLLQAEYHGKKQGLRAGVLGVLEALRKVHPCS